MKVLLANPRGFCAGVDRAIEIVERALGLFGAPIYVRHEVVHNRYVVDRLRAMGAVFVDELDQVPDGATVIFSAHGVSRAVQEEAVRRGLAVFDATCPLVTKVHMEVKRYAREGRDVVLIGHAGHPEVEGTMGQFDRAAGGRIHLVESPADVAGLSIREPSRLALVTQTTLSVDDTALVVEALRKRADRRGFTDQLELQPPARDCRHARHPGLPRGRAGRPRARLVRRRVDGRGHCGRFRTGGPGRARGGAPPRMGRGSADRGPGPGGERDLRPAGGAAQGAPRSGATGVPLKPLTGRRQAGRALPPALLRRIATRCIGGPAATGGIQAELVAPFVVLLARATPR